MEESQVLKRTLAGLALICCIGALSLSASALAPCDGDKQCSAHDQKIAQVKSATDCPYAAKVAQVKSDADYAAKCAAAKAAQVAQVKSVEKSACCAAAAKAAQVAQVKSDAAPQCSATAEAARVAQVKSQACAAKCAAAKAAQVAQVTSKSNCCAEAAKAARVAQVKRAACAANCGTANAKYVAFGCSKTDAAVRKAAHAYLKAVAQMQEKSGAKGCAVEAATKTLTAVVSEIMADYRGKAASAKSAAPAVATVSLGSVSECGPDCTKACCTK